MEVYQLLWVVLVGLQRVKKRGRGWRGETGRGQKGRGERGKRRVDFTDGYDEMPGWT